MRIAQQLFGGARVALVCLAMVSANALASADPQLVQGIQRDLRVLGYETERIDGVMDTSTIVAISKFQAEKGLEITGEATPQLAGTLQAAVDGTLTAVSVAPEAVRDDASLEAAQRACLEEKIAEAQQKSKKRRGVNKLLRAAGRVAGRMGEREVSEGISDIYTVNATMADLESAAEDLGISEDEIEDCRNQ